MLFPTSQTLSKYLRPLKIKDDKESTIKEIIPNTHITKNI